MYKNLTWVYTILLSTTTHSPFCSYPTRERKKGRQSWTTVSHEVESRRQQQQQQQSCLIGFEATPRQATSDQILLYRSTMAPPPTPAAARGRKSKIIGKNIVKLREEDGSDRLLIPGQPDYTRCDNTLITSKYTILNFLPIVSIQSWLLLWRPCMNRIAVEF